MIGINGAEQLCGLFQEANVASGQLQWGGIRANASLD